MKEKNANKPEKKGVKIVKAILNTIINILIVLVLIASILVAAMALTSKASGNGVPNIFGYTLQYVESPSMDAPSPDGYEGGPFTDKDVLIGRMYNPDEFLEFHEGDIITFNSHQTDDAGNEMMITHRIVKVETDSNGDVCYQTWGDNREIADAPDQFDDGSGSNLELLHTRDIVAVFYTDSYQGTILTGWAGFMRTLRSQGGFFGFVLIPMIIFFLYAMIRVVLNATDYRKAKEKDMKEEAEKEKKEAVEAAVKAALEANQAQTQTAAPAAAAPSAGVTAEQMEQFKQFLAFQQMQNAAAQAAPPAAPAAETPAEAEAEEPEAEAEEVPAPEEE